MSVKTCLKSDVSSGSSSAPSSLCEIDSSNDAIAAAHEERVRLELNAQYRELRRQAQGVFDALKGRIGAKNEDYLAQVFDKARVDYSSGQFLVQRLGADRQLDLPLVATLTQLRQGLLVGIEQPTAADHMLADAAVLAYRNLMRVQGWLGSLCLELERNLFGQINHSGADLHEIEAAMANIQEKLIPMQERCQRMLVRALSELQYRKSSRTEASIKIGRAGQVNVR